MLVFFLPVKPRETKSNSDLGLSKIEFSCKILPQLKKVTDTNLFQTILLAPASLYRQYFNEDDERVVLFCL